MCPTLAQGVNASVDNIGGRVEIGLADFEVDDVLPLFLERASAVQDFKCGFGAKPRHPAGKTQFMLD